jgi:CRISPR-associated protein Csm1
MGNINREELYLGALLEHIPVIAIQKTFNNINGIEAILRKANQYASANQYKKGDKQDYVLSPFENLKKANLKKANMTADYKFKPQVLNLSDAFFPKKGNVVDSKGINGLWNQFEQEFDRLAVQQNLTYRAETTLSLLEKNTVTIPNPTAIHPEVSWYDYTKIKAGLAVCIHDYLDANNKTEINNDENPLLIIRADISGIQGFINNIASKNASKNLKGRSFYVQLLVDTVLKLMLKKLNLFEGNVMYASGGNFFVIAPNTEFVKDAFREFEEEVTAAIFAEHQIRISVVMGYQKVSQNDILSGNINEVIAQLFDDVINKKKKQKFSVLIGDTVIDKNGLDGYDKFFNEKYGDDGGEQVLDAITGEEIDTSKDWVYEIKGSSPNKIPVSQITVEKDIIKEATASQIFLGKILKGVDYIVTADYQLDNVKNERVVNPCNLGLYHHIIGNDDDSKAAFQKEAKGKVDLSITRINMVDNHFITEKENQHNSMLYGGNKAPTIEKTDIDSNGDKRYAGTPKYFHELSSDGSFKRLGVLKMDIDGLGTIFKNSVPYPKYVDTNNKGEKRPYLTFSYYAALSRNLDWFFKGYLNTIWNSDYKFRKNTQIIYSGGDDLFIIGQWNFIIEFAEKIKSEFKRFTGVEENEEGKKCEQVTISGGISIVTDKFPIMKAADFAGEAEHRAKAHELKQKEQVKRCEDFYFQKDSIDLLGVSLNWETEYKLVQTLKNELMNSVGEGRGQIPKSLLSKIRIHAYSAKMYQRNKLKYPRQKIKYEKDIIEYEKHGDNSRTKPEKPNAPSPKWIWTVVYDFSRLSNRLNGDNQKLMKTLQKIVDENAKETIKNLFKNKELVDNLSKSAFTNTWRGQEIKSKYHFLELLSIAARWAELEIRS